MFDTTQMEVYYSEIAASLLKMIPTEWNKVLLYAEVLDDSTEVYFYFNPKETMEFVYSHNIPQKYSVSEGHYQSLLFELFGKFRELRNEFKKNEQNLWTNLTMILDRSGKFKIDYSYDDVLKSGLLPSERNVLWEYKYLGKYPEKERKRKFLEEYLLKNPMEKQH